MFIIDEKTNKIILTKGDTATMLVEVFDLNNNKYEIKGTDVVKMTVKKTPNSQVSITKTADSNHYVTITGSDTNSLAAGLYVYDVLLTTESGFVYTIIPTSFFEIKSEVSI